MHALHFLALSLALNAAVAQTPPSAESVLKEAKAKAVAEHKTIFIHFGASWCGWCKRLDRFLESREIQPILEDHFVLVKLVVKENEKNKHLENAGGETLLGSLGGSNSGLPFFALLDEAGKVIVDSKRPVSGEVKGDTNIGYPSEAAEVVWFLTMLRKAAPKLTEAQARTIEDYLKKPQK